ncbi:hypothetical protein B0H14DRAFT_1475745 [Mycena olivaceomarginata]|nr:hypothetical protein B0H14DRAFT_1475745 [Mycena olivaceomarginata]
MNLPVEIALHILRYATGCSQGTYRSLLLTNKRISDLIRIEMLSGVAVVLTSERQTVAFWFFLQDRHEFIPHIHALWAITPTSIDSSLSTFSISVEVILDIIAICTNLRSLASNPSILYMAVFRHRTLVHTHLVHLTMLSTGLHSYWHRLRAFEPGSRARPTTRIVAHHRRRHAREEALGRRVSPEDEQPQPPVDFDGLAEEPRWRYFYRGDRVAQATAGGHHVAPAGEGAAGTFGRGTGDRRPFQCRSPPKRFKRV